MQVFDNDPGRTLDARRVFANHWRKCSVFGAPYGSAILMFMSSSLLFSLSALFAMLPATAYGLFGRPDDGGGGSFWAALAVALAGTLTWTWTQFSNGWHTGFAASLWLTISATLLLFALFAVAMPSARKLGALLLPYLSLLALLALLWERAPERALGAPLSLWAVTHISVSILAYAFATLAAVAAVGVIWRERTLKSKADRATAWPAGLPAVAEGEWLQTRLLIAAAIMLAAGIATGMATQLVEFGAWLPLNHKVILALIAFGIVLVLLLLHVRLGLTGRRAARILLAAYLLLSLAYPGVKFVTDVLVGAP